MTDPNTGAITGGMRKFVDTLPGLNTPNDLGQMLPVANPDTVTFPGSDYYEIAVTQYQAQMHADLPPTTLRGYVQLNSGTDSSGQNTIAPPSAPFYLGPVIVAQRDRPVRIKFVNLLPTGSGGDLFIPVDKTVMGAGMGPTGQPYLDNRATIHLHGGNTPWISDGTPHQWTVPAGDSGTAYPKGVSTQNVPDMYFVNGMVVPVCTTTVTANCSGGTLAQLPPGATNDPGPGAMTFYYPNQQSARLMFYHDHAYGTTRLNVYVGEAAGYVLQDPFETSMVSAGIIPANQIPLIIQDKSFVPTNPTSASVYSVGVLSGGSNYTTSPTITFANGGCTTLPTATATVGDMLGDFGDVIPMAILNITLTNGGSGCTSSPDVLISDPVGTGAVAFASLATLAQQDPTWDTAKWGGFGNLWFPHVYMTNQYPDNPDGSNMNAMGRWDYGMWFWPPVTTLAHGDIACPTPSIPNQTCPGFPTPMNPDPDTGSTSSLVPEAFMDTPVVNGTAYPTMTVQPQAYRLRILNASNDRTLNLSLFKADPTVTTVDGRHNTEVKMVPAAPTYGFPVYWPTDGRDGGVPDPATAGPSWIQIGTEGGLMPNPVVIPPTPVGYEYNRRSVTVLNVSTKGLFLGPAERADVIVDFSAFAGQTLILYNDAPAPVPAFDSRYDYYTDDEDQTAVGGAPTTLPGYGPNTRTVMQIQVAAGTPVPYQHMSQLQNVLPQAFNATQPPPIVPEAAYGKAYNTTFPNTYARLQDYSLNFTPIGANAPVTLPLLDKTIQELFELNYGRMNATLGTELPFTNFNTQTTIPLGYIDPPTETFTDSAGVAGQPVGTLGDGTQIWKITHNGVDTHAIHFHLFNVQLLDRFGWDGTTRPPDPNEIGWKETVRMNPLEIDFVALRPVSQNLPWPIPDSIRVLDVTMPEGVVDPMMSPVNATGGRADQINALTNFGWEYVWHCHLLGHEENDMMRAMVFQVPPAAPSNLTGGFASGSSIDLSFTDNSASETSFVLQRAIDPNFTQGVTPQTLAPQPGYGSSVVFQDTSNVVQGSTYYYRVQSISGNGTSPWSATAQVVPGVPQTITFGPLVNVTYGVGPFTISATASSGLPVTFTVVSGPATVSGSTVTITGIGPVTIQADQAGNSQYLPAPPVQQSFTVAPATLTVTANNVTRLYGQPNPTFTYGVTGFVYGENQSVLTGTPNLTTTAVPSSPPGAYPISITQGNLAAANYTFAFVNGTLTVSAVQVTPASWDFGNQIVGTSSTPQVFHLTNLGPTSLTNIHVAKAGLNPGDFLLTSTCNTTILSGRTCTIATVTFRPTASGQRSATLVITSSDPGSPQTVTLTGTGLGASLSLSPSSLSFSSPLNITSASQVVTVTNTGAGQLTINSIGVGGTNANQFAQTKTCGTTLAAGSSCTVNVTFRPTSAIPGTKNASLNVTVASPATSQSVALTGTLVAPTYTLSPTSLTFGTVAHGSSSSPQTVMVTNTSPLAFLTFTSITNVGPDAAEFVVQNGNCLSTLSPGAHCQFTVTFKPGLPVGAKGTTVNLNAAAPGTSSSVSVSGTSN